MIDGQDFFEAKMDAMRAHATQIAVDGPFFALADGVGMTSWGREYFQQVQGVPGERPEGEQWESDLFSGLEP